MWSVIKTFMLGFILYSIVAVLAFVVESHYQIPSKWFFFIKGFFAAVISYELYLPLLSKSKGKPSSLTRC